MNIFVSSKTNPEISKQTFKYFTVKTVNLIILNSNALNYIIVRLKNMWSTNTFILLKLANLKEDLLLDPRLFTTLLMNLIAI